MKQPELLYFRAGGDDLDGVEIGTEFEPHEEGLEFDESRMDRGEDRFCTEHLDFVPDGECGKICPEYLPMNGKRGKCRHVRYSYVPTGRRFTVVVGRLTEGANV